VTAPDSDTRFSARPGATGRLGSRRWLRVPAIAAPIAVIGGWTAAAAVQPAGYSSRRSSISDLAASYATHREIMTAALFVSGACLVLIAAGLHSVPAAGRAALAVSGFGVLVVAASPLPVGWVWHAPAALAAFGGLTWWPMFATRSGVTPLLDRSRAVTVTAFGTLVLGCLYFAPGLAGGYGVAERLLVGGELLWLCAVVLACTRRPGR
jgi:hypothetical membrane protein